MQVKRPSFLESMFTWISHGSSTGPWKQTSKESPIFSPLSNEQVNASAFCIEEEDDDVTIDFRPDTPPNRKLEFEDDSLEGSRSAASTKMNTETASDQHASNRKSKMAEICERLSGRSQR